MKTFGFPKAEHLCLRREIDALFSSGSRALSVYPLRVVFRLVPAEKPPRAKVLLSVSKRRLRHAVDRNRAKRQMREAYRHNKHIVLPLVPAGHCLHLGIIWLAEGSIDSDRIAACMRRALQQIAEKHLAAATITPQEPTDIEENA